MNARRGLLVAAGVGPIGAVGAIGYALLVRGSLTLDLGLGRRVRPLEPMSVPIAASRETVLAVIAAPYLKRTARAMRDKLRVLERGTDMVLAEHLFPLGAGLTITTVETVRFEAPGLVAFRLMRGPVPHLVETFELHESAGGTVLEYRGEIGTDLWSLGSWWGRQVARTWESVVADSLSRIGAEAERQAGRAAAP